MKIYIFIHITIYIYTHIYIYCHWTATSMWSSYFGLWFSLTPLVVTIHTHTHTQMHTHTHTHIQSAFIQLLPCGSFESATSIDLEHRPGGPPRGADLPDTTSYTIDPVHINNFTSQFHNRAEDEKLERLNHHEISCEMGFSPSFVSLIFYFTLLEGQKM